MAIQTLSELFLTVAGYNKSACLLQKIGTRWVAISTAELVDRVRRLAKVLRDLGVERGDRVALMAENGPHWPTVDFATLSMGAVLVPIYPTLLPEQAAYIARDSGSKILFAQGEERLRGMRGMAGEMPAVRHYVAIDAPGDEDVPTLPDLIERGAGVDPKEFEGWARQCRPGDLATLIYTSGTTGQPKGVMLTHDNITSNVLASCKVLDIQGEYTALSFLPLSHSFERTVDYIYFYLGCTIAYAQSVQTVAQDLTEVRPHVFVSVPRVYEKVLARVHETVAKGSAVKQKIFQWAQGVAREALPYRLKAQRPHGLLGLKLALANRLVFNKIQARLGGRFEFAISGGAPLAREIAEFFWGAGIPIFEGYGLTETSPVIAVNTWQAIKLGTVGKPIPGVEVRIADDGELLVRGPNVMKGYFNNPEATAEALEPDGWLHTGDIAQLDEEGFLSITDRKKELIVNAYGKNIPPAPIENALKSSPLIGQAVVLGDRRKFLTALLVPDFEALKAWAARQGIQAEEHESLLQLPEVRDLYAREVGEVNSRLTGYEQIKAWELLPQEFTIETGELTPTQKVKRRVIHDKYGEIIDRMYQEAEARYEAEKAPVEAK